MRDVFFQLAFGAYLGAFFNLNPALERDGYHMLVDLLRQPRPRGKLYLRIVAAWSAVAVVLAVALSLRYQPVLDQVLPDPVAWIVLSGFWMAPLVPLALILRRT